MIEALIVLSILGLICVVILSITINSVNSRVKMLEQDLHARGIEILKLQSGIRMLNMDIEYGAEYGKAVYRYMLRKDEQFMQQELQFEKHIKISKGLVSTEAIT